MLINRLVQNRVVTYVESNRTEQFKLTSLVIEGCYNAGGFSEQLLSYML